MRVDGQLDETGEYVYIESPETIDTKAIFNKRAEEDGIIYIIPVCEQNPSVLGKTPGEDASDVYNDSSIRVVFSDNMDESSIYYTEQELQGLGNVTYLSSSSDSSKIYGYEKDGLQYYKNIQIKNRNNNDISILDYFDEPEFIAPDTLLIPTKKGKTISPYTQLSVSLSPSFMKITEDDYKVPMGQTESWLYTVGNKTDDVAPDLLLDVWAMESVFKNRSNVSQSKWEESWTKFTDSTVSGYGSFTDAAIYVRDRKLKLSATISDSGSGVASLRVVLYQAQYSFVGNTKYNFLVPVTGSGATATFGEYTNTHDLAKASEFSINVNDGYYALRFIAVDNNGNTKKSNYYYILIDNTNPATDAPTSVISTTNTIKINQKSAGISSNLYYQIKNDEGTYGAPVKITTNNQTIPSLIAGTNYTIKLFETDEFGNSSNAQIFSKHTAPAASESNTVSYADGTATVNWTKPTGLYSGSFIKVDRYKPYAMDLSAVGNLVASGEMTANIPAQTNLDSYQKEFTGFVPGYKYFFTLQSYDSTDPYQNDTSSRLTIGDAVLTNPNYITIPPAKISDFSVSDNTSSQGSIKVNWTKPEGFTNDYLIEYKKSSDSTWTSARYFSETATNTSISSLATGTVYDFKITSRVATASSASPLASGEPSHVITFLTRPAAPTGLSYSDRTNESITLTWTGLTSNYDGYRLGYQNTSIASSPMQYMDISKGSTSITVSELTAGNNYSFYLESYIIDGDSRKYSDSRTLASKTNPNPVKNLTYDPLVKKIRLKWDKPDGSYSGIVIETKKSTDTTYSTVATLSGTSALEYELDITDETIAYDINVYAYYENNTNRSEARSIQATAGVAPVRDLAVKATSETSVTLTFTSPAVNTFDTITIKYTNLTVSGSTALSKTVTKKTNSTSYEVEVTGLLPGNQYGFDVYTGVTRTANGVPKTYETFSSITQSARPKPVSNVSVTRNEDRYTVTWVNPSGTNAGTRAGYYIFYSTTNNLSTASYDYFYENATDTSRDIKVTLSKGNYYYIWVVPFAKVRPGNQAVKAGTSLVHSLTNTPGTFYSRPSAPTGLTVTSTSQTAVTVSWTAPSTGSYTGYRVYQKLSTDSSYTLMKNLTSAVTSYTYTGLTTGSQYDFKVVSYYSSITNESADAVVTLNARPAAASNIRVVRNSSNPSTSLDVSWSLPSSADSAYVFYGTSSSLANATYCTSSSSGTTITGLTTGTCYYVWVVTYSGTAPDTLEVKNGTSLNTTVSSYYTTYTKPSVPSNLTSTDVTTTSIKLQWTKPSSGSYSGYRIYKKDKTNNESSFTLVSAISSTVTNPTYEVTSLSAGHQYEFDVRTYAGQAANESNSVSTTLTKYTKPPVTDFNVSRKTGSTTSTQTLNWTYPVSRSDGYIYIYYGTSSSFANATYYDWWNGSSHSTTTSQDVSSLNANTTYYWWIVSCVGSKLNSPTAEEILASEQANVGSCKSLKTAPSAPSLSTISTYMDDGQGRVKFKWYGPSGATNMQVKIGSTEYATYISSASYYNYTDWIDIPSYTRGSTYTISFTSKDATGLGGSVSYSYSNSSGNMVIYGTTYSYTALKNANTVSGRTVAKSSAYRWKSDGNDVYRSVFNTNSAYTSSGSGSTVTIPVYSMGAYEVSQQLYQYIMGVNPSNHTNNVYNPVENVRLTDAMLFCNKLSTLFGYSPVYEIYYNGSWVSTWAVGTSVSTGNVYNYTSRNGYRLPTKTMWEFAARGGNPNNSSHWGSCYSGALDNGNTGADYRKRVAVDNSIGDTQPVYYQRNSSYLNLLGLYNMSGNVWEWVWEISEKDSSKYLQMGGSWDNQSRCAVDSSAQETPGSYDNKTGFRISRLKTIN